MLLFNRLSAVAISLLIFNLWSQQLFGKSAWSACNEVGEKDENGIESTIYPVSDEALQCILWGEIGILDYDDGPGTEVKDGWKWTNENTTRALICRNNKGKGINDREVGCQCVDEEDQRGETKRNWDDIERQIDEENLKQDSMSPEDREEYCDGWYHWYHDDLSKTGDENGGYMTPSIYKKTEDRHLNRPEDHRIIVPVNGDGGFGPFKIIFPHDDDIDGRWNN